MYPSRIHIYTIYGQLVQTGQLNDVIIQVEELARGTYYLELSQEDKKPIRFVKME